jgi:hypothetical protein
MTAWKEIRHQVLDRIKNGISSIGRQQRSTTHGKSKNKSRGSNRRKKEISPQEMVAIIASIVIIIMALGGLGLVYNVFAQSI